MEVIGPHSVTCASIEDKAVDAMLAAEKIQVLYSDPPWGAGNLSYWTTMNRKQTGRHYSPLTFEALCERFAQIIKQYVDGAVFIETGVRWEGQLAEILGRVLHTVKAERIVYRSGSKKLENSILYGSTVAGQEINVSLKGGIGLPLVVRAVGSVAVKGGICCDPCCGMGYTARAAVAAGMRFRGNEFNEKRLGKTIAFLKKAVA